jgi:glycosyltransferase involved in cell wall biosynthesis
LETTHIALGIIPLPLTPYYHLALPVKLMDYLSLGIPVVSTACREIVTFMEHYPVGLTAQDNPEALSQAILTLLQDREQRLKMAERARQLAQSDLSWHHRALNLLDSLVRHQ